MKKGIVFSIEEFAVFDGPGIRTTVFFKGCPMRCSWCHNPEGLSAKPQLIRNPNGCLRCGRCEKVLAKEISSITDEDLSVCPKKLLRVSGKEYPAGELADLLLKNEDILRMNEGGVTFSGGECLMQTEFLLETLRFLDGRLHTAIETGGCVDPADFQRAVEKIDFVFFDLKIRNEEKALRYTGRDTRLTDRNFEILKKSGKQFVVRMPLIPSVTDTAENYARVAERVKGSGALRVELLPYNGFAGSKYALIGEKYSPGFDEKKSPVVDLEIFRRNGIEATVF